MGAQLRDDTRNTAHEGASAAANSPPRLDVSQPIRLLTIAGLFLGYLTFLILGPALFWGLRRMLPEDRLYWTLGGVGYLSRNLSLIAVALLSAWGVLGRGNPLRRLVVTVLGSTWIWMAYFAGLIIINRLKSDTAVALGAFGICIACAAGILRALKGWRIATPLDDVTPLKTWQFQIRDMLLGMAALGATLATFLRLPGDVFGTFADASRYYMYVSFWENTFWHYLIPLPIVLLCLPAPRLGRRFVALALLVSLLLILVEPVLYFLVIDPSHNPIEHSRYPQGLRIFAIQRLELAFLCLGTVALLQRVGFRLEFPRKIEP